MLADRVMCAVPNPGPVDVGSTITLGAAPTGYRSYLVAFGGAKPAYFVLSDGAGRTLTGIWTVNATVPETATITEILGNDRTGDTSGEIFAGDCAAWNEVPARDVVSRRGVAVTGNISATGDISGASLNGGPLAGLRNLIINGNPVINQRNVVSGATMLGYGLDRWRTTVSGAVSWTDSGGVRTVTAPAGGMYQIIEGLSVAGGVYTLSYQGTATAKVNGVTVANGGQYTLAAGADASLEFLGGTWAKAQLEPGTLATPFEMRPAAFELMLCRRYFRPLGFDLPMRFNALGNMSTHAPIQFDPPMRGTPTVTPAWTTANGNATGFVVNRLSRFGANAELSSVASGDTYVTLQAATSFSAEL